jgi:hypothetical protein
VNDSGNSAGGTGTATASFAEAQGVQEEGAEFGILPAVDENVDAGVEHEEEVGDVRQDLAPAQKQSS